MDIIAAKFGTNAVDSEQLQKCKLFGKSLFAFQLAYLFIDDQQNS
jgi:hypothetical protein